LNGWNSEHAYNSNIEKTNLILKEPGHRVHSHVYMSAQGKGLHFRHVWLVTEFRFRRQNYVLRDRGPVPSDHILTHRPSTPEPYIPKYALAQYAALIHVLMKHERNKT